MGNKDPKNTSSDEPSVSSQTREGQNKDDHSQESEPRTSKILPPLRRRESRFWQTEGFSEAEEKK